MAPKVSVIIPTLNEEALIEHTLKSLKNQSYKNFEVIVADTSSKDKTKLIAKKYTKKVINVKKHGVSAGRNAGAAIAKGQFLLFIDADTVLPYNTLEEIIKQFKNKKVVGVPTYILPLSSNFIDHIYWWTYNRFLENSIKLKRPQITGICCAYRKSAFDQIGGYNEEMRVMEDFDISERISKTGKIVIANNSFAITSIRRFKVIMKLRNSTIESSINAICLFSYFFNYKYKTNLGSEGYLLFTITRNQSSFLLE